jgi:hypothetical protein
MANSVEIDMAVERPSQPLGLDAPTVIDSARELDIALAGLERPSPTLLLDSLAALMHGCFARGATHVLANVRGAATGKGFPRLFTRIGGSDVTAPVRQFGRGQEGRRYFAAPAEPFYASAEGRKYAGRRAV